MFNGQAEAAMDFYISLFKNSAVKAVTRYGHNEAGPEGTLMLASFTLNGQPFMCINSPAAHQFGFTPAISVYAACETDMEVEMLFNSLSDGGSILMPLGSYPFSKKYAWVTDKFGVSWQLGV